MYGRTNRPVLSIQPIVLDVTPLNNDDHVRIVVLSTYRMNRYDQTATVMPYADNNRPLRRYNNGPARLVEEPWLPDVFKGVESRRARSLRMGYDAIRAAKVAFPEPLPELLYHRPKRKGRACGSRYRVMLP